MAGDAFSIKAPKECSKKFAATLRGKSLTRGNVLRIFPLFLEEFWVFFLKRCRDSSCSDKGGAKGKRGTRICLPVHLCLQQMSSPPVCLPPV